MGEVHALLAVDDGTGGKMTERKVFAMWAACCFIVALIHLLAAWVRHRFWYSRNSTDRMRQVDTAAMVTAGVDWFAIGTVLVIAGFVVR